MLLPSLLVQTDVKPSHVLFLEGCFVEPVNHEERNRQCRYGIEIILSEEAHKSRFLYASSSAQRQQWMDAIRYHANVHSVEDYYDIREELGVGRFSSVRMGVSKQSGKQYAIKIIDKANIDEKEREALRTEVAVLKLLNHPHIIKCKNVFETRKQMYIVMTFVSGQRRPRRPAQPSDEPPPTHVRLTDASPALSAVSVSMCVRQAVICSTAS